LVAPPEDDDLIALANAVRESCDSVAARAPVNGFSDPGCHTSGTSAAVSGNGALVPTAHRPNGTGRRRGHLRVLPDLPT